MEYLGDEKLTEETLEKYAILLIHVLNFGF